MLRAEGLKGAIIYYDGQMNDTRMGLTVALTASQHGAVVANRVKVGKGEGDGGVRDVCVCVWGGGVGRWDGDWWGERRVCRRRVVVTRVVDSLIHHPRLLKHDNGPRW